MIKFELFYKRYGFNKLTHLFSPTILRTSSLSYPFESDLHYFTITESPEVMFKNNIYITSHPKVLCYNVIDYSGDMEGLFIKKNFQKLAFYKSLCKDPELKYIRPNQASFTIPRTALIVHNYSPIQFGYKYKKARARLLWKYNNTVNTLLRRTKDNLNKRNIFITIELPDQLPTRTTLTIFTKALTPSRLRSITDYRYFNLLHLWKFLTPNLKSTSWFDQYTTEEKIRINLILQSNDRCIIMNLGLLESIIQEYNEASMTLSNESYYDYLSQGLNNDLLTDYTPEDASMLTKGAYKSIVAQKLFLFSLNKILTFSGKALNVVGGVKNQEIEEDNHQIEESNVNKTLNLIENSKNLEKDIDKIIEEEVPNYNKKVTDPDSITGEKIEDPVDEEERDEELEHYLKDFEEPEEDELDLQDEDLEIQNTTLQDVYVQPTENKQEVIKKTITRLKESGQINKKKENTLRDILIHQDEVHYKIDGVDVPLSIILDTTKDPEKDKLVDQAINEVPTVFDSSFNKNNIRNIDAQYLKNNRTTDSIRVAYSLQNNKNFIVESYQVTENSNILDTTEYHTLKLRHLDGKTTTLTYLLPKINEDGTFKMSGNSYRIRKQRLETPIRKISPTRVVLSSYYGKVFIDKVYKKVYSYGAWLLRRLYANEEVNNIVEDSVVHADIQVNRMYGCFAYSIKSFQFRNYVFNFDYHTRGFNTLTEEQLKQLEINGVIVGKKDDQNYLIMDNESFDFYEVSLNSPKRDLFCRYLDLIGEDASVYEGPIEFAGVRIAGMHVPIVVVLSYYYGLENLLKILKVEYILDDGSEEFQQRKEMIPKDEFKKMIKVVFFDKTLYFKRDFGMNDMILGGLASLKTITETSFKSWNRRNIFSSVYLNLDITPNVQSEIKVLENMFIDPMTLSLLRELKEPETFKGLLFKACELLVDYSYRHPNEITGQVIKGYERLNGMLYRSLAKAVSKYEFESLYSNVKLTLDPYEILKKIKDDSTTVSVDDLNPLVEIKQSEDVSYLGEGGRDVITMTKATRSIHPTEIGVISEATKDNGQVGVTAYLSADPNIKSVRGVVEPVNVEKEGWGKIFSTSALLYPFSDRDTSRRTNFSSIQGAHVIPINNMRPPAVRTGYDSIIALRVSDKFAVSAEEDGKVLDVTNNYIEVEYQSKKVKKYVKRKWTTKEEGGSCYSHELVANFEKGDKFLKDDTLLYDYLFFEPDLFYPGRVIYKEGTLINVAITDDPETYEDSGSIYAGLKNSLGVKNTKVISITVSKEDEILNMVKIGDPVEPTSILFTFINKDAMTFSSMEEEFDPETLELLREMRSSSPKAKVRGIIKNIKIFYNAELDEITKSLKEVISESDRRLKVNDGFPGKVNSSYSINGVPLEKGRIEIKIYIEVTEQLSLGDKAIFGNQIKFTVGESF